MTPRPSSPGSPTGRSSSARSTGRRSAAASATTQPPVIDPIVLDNLVDTDPEQLDPRDSYDGIRLTDADLSGRDLSSIVLSESELVGCTAHETDFRGARVLESRLTRFNAPIFSAPRATLRDVVIEGSRLGSVELFDAELRSVVISQSKLGWVNLRSATLQDVAFRDCTIDELDLAGATLTRVSFEDCRIDQIDVTGAQLRDTDLRGADLRSLTGLTGLAGATIDSAQASALAHVFARHIGLRVED